MFSFKTIHLGKSKKMFMKNKNKYEKKLTYIYNATLVLYILKGTIYDIFLLIHLIILIFLKS